MFTTATTFDLVSLLMSSATRNSQRATAFRELVARPITADALCEAARAMRERMTSVRLSAEAIDTCGTGGSGKKTFNTSTLTAFIVAAAGGKVAKHGNRSASGNCGAGDLLEGLGARIDLTPDEEQRIFDTLGIVFLHAPLHHPMMQLVAPLRRAYGKKTIFNYLGPLCNPADVKRQLIGVGDHLVAGLLAECVRRDTNRRGMIATGHDGLDEVTVTTATTIRTVEAGSVIETLFTPSQFGIPLFPERDVEGGSAAENAAVFRMLASGDADQAKQALVAVNAAHALSLAGLAPSLDDAYHLTRETLASGKVLDLVDRYCHLSHGVTS